MIKLVSKDLVTGGLDQKTDQLLVAISGGVDSVVLTDLLIKSGFKVVLAHMNFGLRGADSDKDEQFVRDLAEKWGVKAEVKRVDTKELKVGSGVSTQMLARDLRYNWFTKLCEKHKAKLVTAHHGGDATETFLLNLIRGTGIKGLTGMHFENNKVFRPLLGYVKQDLIDYAKSEGLLWREDISNTSNDYKRNSLRNEVIPLLKKMNPNFDETLKKVANRLDSVNELVLDAVNDFVSTWVNTQESTRIPIVKKMNTEVLYYSFANFGFNYESILDLVEMLKNNAVGKKVRSESHELFLDRNELILVRLEAETRIDTVLEIGSTQLSSGEVNIQLVDELDKKAISKDVQFFDYSRFTGEIRIRNWQEGDVFKPLGMKGKQKISDFLINNKVPLSEKKKVLVLLVENEIAWLIGYRISNDFRVKDFTKSGIKVSCGL